MQNYNNGMNNAVIQFNQDNALKAGANFVNATGAYVLTIKTAYWKQTPKGNRYLELCTQTSEGETANFINFYYQNAQNQVLHMGNNLINAIMGLCQISELTSQFDTVNNQIYCPELINKTVGLFLQRINYTKEDGSQSFSLSCLDAFNSQTNQTYKEQTNNLMAKRIPYLIENTSDKTETAKTSINTTNNTNNQDVPF